MKNTRKILALVLVLMMVLPMFTMFTVSAASTTVRVYLDNKANWTGTLNCYCWSNASGAPTNGAKTWPGNAMTKDTETGFYYYDIPAGNDMCIFNNGSSQTANLKVPEAASTQIKFNNKDNIWGSLKATCTTHTPGPAATCTDPQLCTVCNDPIKAALGHNYSGAICTRCNAVATYRLVGDEKLCNGVSWDTGADVNKMAYDAETGIYSITINSSKLATGSYKYKVARDGSWGPGEYPASGDSVLNYTAGSDVIVFTWNPAKQELKATPHAHSFVEGKCSCGAEDPTYVPPHTHNFVAGEIVAPTFDAEGYTTYTCSCGGSEKRDIVPALVAVAQVGETKYASLADAIAAAVDGDTITLIENSDLGTGSVTVKGKELTLDLNGHNITGSGYRVLVVDLLRVDGADKRGVLTLTGEGTVKNTGTASGNSYAVYVGGSSDLIVKTGVTLNSDYGFAVLMSPMGAGRTSTLTLDGGSITGRYGVSGNGTLTDTSTSVTINSGSIECTEVGIYQPQPGTVTINGGTISGAEAAIALRRGEATIEGGTIVGLVDVLGDYEASSLAINGGDFTGATLQYSADKGNTLTISGGTFAGDVSNYLADGFELDENGTVVSAHEHAWSDATCTEGQKCECGETQGEALGHDFVEGVCSRCEAADPDYAPEQPPVEEPAPQGIFDMILAWIMSFIEMILGWFKF